MASNLKSTEAGTLELYRVALENVQEQPEIATVMADLGYDSALITEGKQLLEQTRNIFDFNKTEDDETSVAYADFSNRKKDLETIYSLHRKKAKVVFRKDPVTLKQLALDGSLQKSYVKWIETVKKFYSVATTNTEIQGKLARLKITPEDITATNTKVTELEKARAEYLREKGESQDATKAKDAAFAKIDDWMSEFYAVAKIGLEEKPQLLEALGKIVKS
ncbi:MAG: hypothetical protein PHF25_09095 [Candidatus Margulisbacteria bacterium]|jgi:hypothetical protein|nr:hypothetical protein [Candidatus Margulisiibacteriota bacterium]